MADIIADERQDGLTLTATIGDRIILRLEENPTTGFRWSVLGEAAGLTGGESVYHPFKGASVGGGGTREFAFSITAAGKHTLRLALIRAWEGEATTVKRCTLVIAASSE